MGWQDTTSVQVCSIAGRQVCRKKTDDFEAMTKRRACIGESCQVCVYLSDTSARKREISEPVPKSRHRQQERKCDYRLSAICSSRLSAVVGDDGSCAQLQHEMSGRINLAFCCFALSAESFGSIITRWQRNQKTYNEQPINRLPHASPVAIYQFPCAQNQS